MTRHRWSLAALAVVRKNPDRLFDPPSAYCRRKERGDSDEPITSTQVSAGYGQLKTP